MPNRMLRDWTDSESIDLLSADAERFFVRLMMKADDHGNYTGNLKLLKSALFPLKDFTPASLAPLIEECVQANVLQSYSVDGKQYLHIVNFGQRLRTMNAKFPQPDSNPPSDDRNLRTDDIKERPELEEKRREEEEEVEHEGAKFSAFDDLWIEQNILMKKHLYPGVDLLLEIDRFKAKVVAAPQDYASHDTAGMRKALIYHISRAPKGEKAKPKPDIKRFLADA